MHPNDHSYDFRSDWRPPLTRLDRVLISAVLAGLTVALTLATVLMARWAGGAL